MTLQNELDEARAALHRLITGTSTVSIQRDGKRVEFKPADRADLVAYIDRLEQSSGQGLGRRRGPAGVVA